MANEKFLFFWHGPLSQWHKVDFTCAGRTYNCAEQWMMAQKASVHDDLETLESIMKAKDPKRQKELGRQVKNFNADLWNSLAKQLVFTGNMAKFTQNRELKAYLLSTGDKELVEASPYDKIWGIGLSADDPRAQDKSKWLGTNWLGEVLMNVREAIRKAEND